MKNRALGKGLSALIPGAASNGNDVNLLELPVESIAENPFQPRESMDLDALRELADSIKENGILQPLTACKWQGRYTLISGSRRLKAAKMAGLNVVPVYLREVESDAELLELAIVENLQREDLNPIDLAKGYLRLAEECSLTQDEIAKKVGKARPSVTNTIRLLKLPEEIQDAVRKSELSMGHARALLAVENKKAAVKLFQRIQKDGITVRKLEKIIASGKISENEKKAPKSNPYLDDITDRLRAIYATKITITPKGKGGVISIGYYSEDELERLIEMLDRR